MSLKALDHHVISDEEIIENLHLSGKYRALARPFHRLLYQPIDKVSYFIMTGVHKFILSVG